MPPQRVIVMAALVSAFIAAETCALRTGWQPPALVEVASGGTCAMERSEGAQGGAKGQGGEVAHDVGMRGQAVCPQDSVVDLSALPLLDDLLSEHAAALSAVRAHPNLVGRLGPRGVSQPSAVSPPGEGQSSSASSSPGGGDSPLGVLDDLFLLRHVIAQGGDAAAAAKAVGEALDWRSEHVDLIGRMQGMQPEVHAVSPIGMLPWLTLDGQPVMVAMPAAGDWDVLGRKSDQWHLEAGISNRAVAFAACDRLSRESGRLVRLVLIQDLTGTSVTTAYRQRRLMRVQGELSALQEVLFPQLLHKIIVASPPAVVGALFSFARPFLSEGSGARTNTVAHHVLDIVVEGPLPLDRLPAFLGGRRVDWRPQWAPEGP
eukprot:CAMPEP_0185166660 /NCGR_PEP_ID=MMETSP1139-20130426/12991_1 /TAXON_ID=298111 /ORGANISM="Pavlova sp., Strain CCMP459" /LENGTH=373 /DNA_ID=CAMNT_0027732117 /DNA_START=25 /DNA_END=1142 /DNA_ORIENTATION=+